MHLLSHFHSLDNLINQLHPTMKITLKLSVFCTKFCHIVFNLLIFSIYPSIQILVDFHCQSVFGSLRPYSCHFFVVIILAVLFILVLSVLFLLSPIYFLSSARSLMGITPSVTSIAAYDVVS